MFIYLNNLLIFIGRLKRIRKDFIGLYLLERRKIKLILNHYDETYSFSLSRYMILLD